MYSSFMLTIIILNITFFKWEEITGDFPMWGKTSKFKKQCKKLKVEKKIEWATAKKKKKKENQRSI